MKTGTIILLVGLGYIWLNDLFLYLEIKRYLKSKTGKILYAIHSLLFIIGLLSYHFIIPRIKSPEAYFWFGKGIAVLFLCYVPKTIYIVLNGIALMVRRLKLLSGIIHYFAFGLSVLVFFVIFYGITWGRYDYKVVKQEVCIKELPDTFDPFRIVQLTDLHLGSYRKGYAGISELVQKVNALQPDLIVFTGDMVNNFASEMTPWQDTLKLLTSRYGKYAITGNHDYGHYTRWKTEEDRKENLVQFFENMRDMGFHMLNNTNIPLIIQTDTIYLSGVENWGLPPFPQYGKLPEALRGTEGHVVILLSHDPSHWRQEVIYHPVALTLAGHTHAMQMGIQIGRFRWSPSQYIYPEYNGLYKHDRHQLYVSRGAGYLGFPGRIGQRPEITLIELTNDCKQ